MEPAAWPQSRDTAKSGGYRADGDTEIQGVSDTEIQGDRVGSSSRACYPEHNFTKIFTLDSSVVFSSSCSKQTPLSCTRAAAVEEVMHEAGQGNVYVSSSSSSSSLHTSPS